MYNIGDFVVVRDEATGDGVLEELRAIGISTRGFYIVANVLSYGSIQYLRLRFFIASCPIKYIGPISGEYFEKIS